MSRQKKGQPKPFVGHQMTKSDQTAVAVLVGFCCAPFGLPKRLIKREGQIWAMTKAVYGLEPHSGEEFMQAVRRMGRQIRKIEPRQRSVHLAIARAKFAASGLPSDLGTLTRKAEMKMAKAVVLKAKISDKNASSIATRSRKDEFYKSWDWRTLRMQVIKRHGPRCMCCGATPDQTASHGGPVRIVVDHIKPLHTHWHMRLDETNLQILCDECNQGKGAWDHTDWRPEDDAELIDEPMTAIESQLGERFRVVGGTEAG